MIPPGAKIRPPRMTCPPAPLSSVSPLRRRTLGDLPASERGAKILLDWNPYTACTEDQLASIDRPSLFIRKRINKRRGETVYGARSDDKIGPCKSAGYLTGRRTIFEYLPSSPPSPLSPPCRQVTRSPARVLQLSPRAARSFAPAVLYYFMLAEQSFFSLFFCFPRDSRFGPNELSDSFLPKDNKARTWLTRYRSLNKYALTLQ